MLVRSLEHLERRPNHQKSLVLRHAEHTKARLPLRRPTLVNAAELHQLVPRLLGVLLRRVRVHIRHLAPCAARDNVQIQLEQHLAVGQVGRDAYALPRVFLPRVVVAAAYDNVRPEALDRQRVCAGDFGQALVEIVEGGFGGDLQANDVCKVVLLRFAVEFCATVDFDVAVLGGLCRRARRLARRTW